MPLPSAAPGTVIVHTDIVCGWSTVSLHRFYAARARLGLDDSRCISMRHEVLDVATGCADVDVDALREALDDGRARGPMVRDYHDPGIEMHQEGEPGAGFLVLDSDDPSVYDDLVRRAAG